MAGTDERVETAHAVAVRDRGSTDDGDESDRGGGTADATARTAADPLWVGVARSPPGWFRRRVDVHRPALGLAPETRTELDRRRRDLRMRGLCEEGAHNAAWEVLGIDGRYRKRLAEDSVREVLAALAGRDRALVLATDRRPGFRCHRTVLASVLEDE